MNLPKSKSIPTGSTAPGNVICPLTKKVWTFPPHDREAKAKAQAEQLQHTEAVITEREQLAGRTLSDSELLFGITHKEDRTLEQRVKDNTTIKSQSNSKPNPFRIMLTLPRFQNPRNDSDRRKARELEKQANAWDSENAPEPGPDNAEALEHAQKQLDDSRWDASYSASDIAAMQRRLQLAKSDPQAYWEQDTEFRQARADAVEKAASEADAKAREAKQLADSIRNSGRAPVEPAPEIAEPEFGSFAWLRARALDAERERNASE